MHILLLLFSLQMHILLLLFSLQMHILLLYYYCSHLRNQRTDERDTMHLQLQFNFLSETSNEWHSLENAPLLTVCTDVMCI